MCIYFIKFVHIFYRISLFKSSVTNYFLLCDISRTHTNLTNFQVSSGCLSSVLLSATRNVTAWNFRHSLCLRLSWLNCPPYMFAFPTMLCTFNNHISVTIFLCGPLELWHEEYLSQAATAESSGVRHRCFGLGSYQHICVLWTFWRELYKEYCNCLQPGHYSSLTALHLQPTANQERHDQCGKQHHSREVLIMGIGMLETCWAYRKYNKIWSGI